MTGLSENVLRELARHDECVVIDKLDRNLPKHARRDIIKAIGSLISRTLVKRDYAGCYRATNKGREWVAKGKPITSGPTGAHTGTQNRSEDTFVARLWTALRAERKATTRDLVALMRQDGDRKPEFTAARYLGRWFRAGFITKLKTRSPGTSPTSNGYVKWFITRDNGPKAPLWKSESGYVVDGNTGQEFSADGVLIEKEDAS